MLPPGPPLPARAASPVRRAPGAVLAPGALGITPWGTVLAAEENANAFFGTDDLTWQRSETDARHGFSAAGFGHPWHTEDPRFDLASDRARPEHFGWIVEVDPHDPASAPAKRTALGRFAHGSATVSEAAGHVVVHTTDAEDGEYAYRFVGSAPWRRLRAKGLEPLDHGTLEVARLSADGTGEWVPLVHGTGPLTRENGWRDQADIVVRARLAADAVGATPLARPERVAVHPTATDVYLALAGGSRAAAADLRSGRRERLRRAGRITPRQRRTPAPVGTGDPGGPDIHLGDLPDRKRPPGHPGGLLRPPQGTLVRRLRAAVDLHRHPRPPAGRHGRTARVRRPGRLRGPGRAPRQQRAAGC
ncbi:DUF839 domain-containing protein [Streptomyces sp. S6]|nr:DUF839 domain-containing protein [Streptomyces sp. S6]